MQLKTDIISAINNFGIKQNSMLNKTVTNKELPLVLKKLI